jgi:hypothetical protein
MLLFRRSKPRPYSLTSRVPLLHSSSVYHSQHSTLSHSSSLAADTITEKSASGGGSGRSSCSDDLRALDALTLDTIQTRAFEHCGFFDRIGSGGGLKTPLLQTVPTSMTNEEVLVLLLCEIENKYKV